MKKESNNDVNVELTGVGRKVDFSIVVLTHNALEYTKKCLAAIKKNTRISYELIIIDNASTDGTVEWLKESWKKDELGDNIMVFTNEINKGVAGGRNQGIKQASGSFIVFLDNDTEVGAGWDFTIAQEFENPLVGIVGKNGVVVNSMRPLRWSTVVFSSQRSEVDAVSGFCFAFRSEIVDKVGNQWEDFPNPRFWHEDLEFCKRASLAGYKVVANQKVNVVHHEHKSMGDDKHKDIHKPENQFGYEENASYIFKRFQDRNVIYFHQTYKGANDSSAYGRAIKGLSAELRKMGFVVIWKPKIPSKLRSFDLCKMFDLIYRDKRYVSLYQENNVVPNDWESEMGCVDGILGSSEHFLDTVVKTKYADKVRLLPTAGINPEIYNMNVEPMKLYEDKFKFLMVGASQPRKNTKQLIDCYVETFAGNDDVVLILKDGGYGDFFDTAGHIEKVRKSVKKCPLIEHIYAEMTERSLASLYRAVALKGCYIHPHRAECFGMPLIEAVACGCRVGTTKWGGPRTNLKGLKTVTFFGYDPAPSTFHNWKGEPFYDIDENPMWAEPLKEDIKKFMWDAVYGSNSYVHAKESSKIILERFNYRELAENIAEYLVNENFIPSIGEFITKVKKNRFTP